MPKRRKLKRQIRQNRITRLIRYIRQNRITRLISQIKPKRSNLIRQIGQNRPRPIRQKRETESQDRKDR